MPGRRTGGHGHKRVRLAPGHVNKLGTHLTEAISSAH